MNVHDHEGVQVFLDDLGLSLDPARFTPRYNVAPTDPVFAVFGDDSLDIAEMRWGFKPRNPAQRSLLINARGETVWQRPSFRGAMARRRAVVPVNGFYEWRREGSERLPYYIVHHEAPVLPLAGLYEVDEQGEMRCCVLTTAANRDMQAVHDRMPVILDASTVRQWLTATERALLDPLITPLPDGQLALERVSKFVNNSRNEGPECMAPLAA